MNLRGLGLLALIAFVGLASVGCGGARIDGHGVLFVRKDPGSDCTVGWR